MSIFSCCVSRQVDEDVRILDFRHCGLTQLPSAVFNAERTLEILHIDSNQLKSLPRELFHCHGLRYLTLSDNDITTLPLAICNLTNVEQLDVSKNGILELPDLKSLKYLSELDASVNPLGKLPDGFTQLLNLTKLCLNDCFLEYLPGNFGRLSKLKSLELRENHLKTLPQSLSRLEQLERLDVGCNEFTELPGNVIATLSSLLELWCDSNQITSIPKEIGNLKQLMYFDACKNRITELPDEIYGCLSLSDLHLTTNLLETLPQSIGKLSNLTTLKVNDNQLVSIPTSIGGLVSLSELDISANDLQEVPPTIGLLRHLRTLIADENFLADLPSELGSCSGLTVLSVRSNKLTYLPDEIGRIPRLRVLNLSDNEIKVLPYSLTNLKELQALWLAENQSKALIRLQSAVDKETQRRCLTCYLLPQQRMDPLDSYGDDNQSFHPSLWEETRQQRQQIQFEDSKKNAQDEAAQSHYPKEMRVMTRHVQNEAMRKSTSGDNSTPEHTVSSPREQSNNEVVIGNGQISPKTATHRLFKLEKEKVAKDKARINRLSQEINPADVKLEHKEQASPTAAAEYRRHHSHTHKSKDKRSSRHSDRGSIAETDDLAASKPLLNGSVKSVSIAANQEPKVIPNGRYHVTATPDFRRSNNSMLSHSSSHPNRSSAEQTYNRYSLNHTPAANGNEEITSSRQSVHGDQRGSSVKLSNSGTSSQAVLQQEETFGVFASDEDPKLYQRRFKYYQRMRKHRKNPEVQSDLGYYGRQYPGGSTKAASDSGGGHRRRPLQQGRDGYDKWERYSQRSMGDGYASDLEGINQTNKQVLPVPNYMQSHYRSNSRKSLQDSRNSLGEKRPSVPPSYTAVMANRSDVKNVENTPFPPPPPYKPPPRDPGPDGASNDGVPRSSPTDEQQPSDRDMPFRSYSEYEKSLATQSYHQSSEHNSHIVNGATDTNTPSTAPNLAGSRNRLHMTSTPLTTSAIVTETPHHSVVGVTRSLSAHGKLYHTPSSAMSNYSHIEQLPGRRSSRIEHAQQPNNRTSFYDAQYQDDSQDSEYMAQISKNLGRLGYGRDTDKGPAQPPPPQFSNDNVDMVPPPALFCGKDTLARNESNNELQNQMYQSYNHQCESNTPSKQYTPSSTRRVYQPPINNSQHQPMSNQSSNYSYLPPPNRKSPKLPHKQMIPSGLEVDEVETPPPPNVRRTTIEIVKNPGLGFSVAGGIGLQGNPYRPLDEGIFVTKVTQDGPAAKLLQPGDKILTVNEYNLTHMEHNEAVNILKNSPNRVTLNIERLLPTDV